MKVTEDRMSVSIAAPEVNTWSLAIHGGAGTIDRAKLTPENEKLYRDGMKAALAAGEAVLSKGGSALDAVEAAVWVLEDDPMFNAGRGAVFTAEGQCDLDAAIMDGAMGRAGAVAGIRRTKSPVSLARAVMERSKHVFLMGVGAEAFSVEQGLEQVEPEYFHTDKRWQQYLKWKQGIILSEIDPEHRFGTVGAVALDQAGHLAAATSTGGLTGKLWGRIGDSPVIGAGTMAKDGVCAVSCTGTGEYFIIESAGRQICDRIQWNHEDVQSAADNTLSAIGRIGGDGGLIAMGGDGTVAFSLNTAGMYRACVSSNTAAKTWIFANEAGE
jgi:L-asparaginase / beta-aspartyl-peptidase